SWPCPPPYPAPFPYTTLFRSPSRVMGRAGRNALSVHFDVPPKEFIFLVRKLLGAYTFLHVIRAEIRGNTLLEPFFPMQEEEDKRSEEHTSELQSRFDLVCRLL